MMKARVLHLFVTALTLIVLAGCAPQGKPAAGGNQPAVQGTSPGGQNSQPGLENPALGKAAPLGETPPELGKPPADIAFTDATGKQFKLSELKDKAVLLDFWASWCGPCKQELPHLARLDREYRDKGFIIIGIACQSKPEEVTPLLKDAKVEYQIYMDDSNLIAAAWEVPAFPSLVLIGKDGKVAAAMVGARPYEALKTMVEDVLAGRPLQNQQLPS